VEFGILGPVEVQVAGQATDTGHPRQRAVLAVLLLDLGLVVPPELLIDRVWGEEPPASVRNVLYGYVARLRAILASASDPRVTLARRPGGYLLQARHGQLDLNRFRRLAADAAAAAGDDTRASGLLRQALSLWRGPALAGVDSPWLNAMRETLELERTAAVLDLSDVRLRQGEHSALVSELAREVESRSTDERLIGQLILALYRSGRQTEALGWFERTRKRLAEELGADPGPDLRALHQRVLRADLSLDLVRDPGHGAAELRNAGLRTAQDGAAERGAGDQGTGELGAGAPAAPGPGATGPGATGYGTAGPRANGDGRQLDEALASGVRESGVGVSEAFVGRSRELAILEDAAATARGGRSPVVLVDGEAGSGKSALLARFGAGQTAATVLRASGNQEEQGLPYGLVTQLAASVPGGGYLPLPLSPPGAEPRGATDPAVVGTQLVAWLRRLSAEPGLVIVIIDDLPWADEASARALLFAVRRLLAAPVLVVASARTAELGRLDQGWQRFLGGHHQVARVRLEGFSAAEVTLLGRALGRGELSAPIVKRLIAETGGHPLYCRALLEESGLETAGLERAVPEQAGLDYADERQNAAAMRVPRGLAGLVLGRTLALSPAVRDLIMAVAVLGSPCTLSTAARLAELADPMAALDEAVAAGILTEQPGTEESGVGFAQRIVQRASYASLSPKRRRVLHLRAADLVDPESAAVHRIAAAGGPDDQLAAELEAAAWEAHRLGMPAQAAVLLSRSAAVSANDEAVSRRHLDALEMLVNYGKLADAEALVSRMPVIRPGARRSWLLGTVDFLAGRMAAAEEHLADAWRLYQQGRDARDQGGPDHRDQDPLGHDVKAHDDASDGSGARDQDASQHADGDARPASGAAIRLTILCASAGRIRESIEWGERAAAAAPDLAWRAAAVGALAIGLCRAGRGTEALGRLAIFPAPAAEVPLSDTDALVLRGIARAIAEDLRGAIADLSVGAARLRAGVPVRTASWCLSFLAGAEYRRGSWDEAALDAEMAVSLAAGRPWELAFAHSLAAVVPAQRGEWEAAAAHVRLAREAARANGDVGTIGAASAAHEYLALAQGDLDGVLGAASAIRAAGSSEFYYLAASYDWRFLEVEALILLGRVDRAWASLAGIQADLAVFGPPAARVTAARLRAEVSLAVGQPAAASMAVGDAWRFARHLQAPLPLAQLEITEARLLDETGQAAAAAARLAAARRRLSRLGAVPEQRAYSRPVAVP